MIAADTPAQRGAQNAAQAEPGARGGELVAARRNGELVPDQGMADKLAYADQLARSGLLPRYFRGNPANVLWAIEYGAMLGLPPIAAITGVYVVEGVPTAKASMISALVRRAGHRLRVTLTRDEQGLPVGRAQIVRKDDPDFVFESTWTVERAVRAGLCKLSADGRPFSRSKEGNKILSWEAYPEAMVKWRAVTEVARDACEEALCGIHYTPEELGAEVNADGDLIAFPEGSPERAAVERGEAFEHAQKAAQRAAQGSVHASLPGPRQGGGSRPRGQQEGQQGRAEEDGEDIADAEIVPPKLFDDTGLDDSARHELLAAELEEMAHVRGDSFESTASTLARRAGAASIAELDAARLGTAMGEVRQFILQRLYKHAATAADPGQADVLARAADCYAPYCSPREDGRYPTAPTEQLFGTESLAFLTGGEAGGAASGSGGEEAGGAGRASHPHPFVEPNPASPDADPSLCGREDCGRDREDAVHVRWEKAARAIAAGVAGDGGSDPGGASG